MMGQEHDQECDEMEEPMMMHHMPPKVKKDFKLALLRKKERMLEAKLAFVREMKDMVEKWQPEEEKGK
jgi:hypothetical protein